MAQAGMEGCGGRRGSPTSAAQGPPGRGEVIPALLSNSEGQEPQSTHARLQGELSERPSMSHSGRGAPQKTGREG